MNTRFSADSQIKEYLLNVETHKLYSKYLVERELRCSNRKKSTALV